LDGFDAAVGSDFVGLDAAQTERAAVVLGLYDCETEVDTKRGFIIDGSGGLGGFVGRSTGASAMMSAGFAGFVDVFDRVCCDFRALEEFKSSSSLSSACGETAGCSNLLVFGLSMELPSSIGLDSFTDDFFDMSSSFS